MRGLVGQINKSAEHPIMAFAADVPNTYELRRPSGIMQLDIDTGGGLPAGTLCYIGGPDGAGKTFLTLRYMYMHQRLYGDQAAIAYGISEGGFDFRRAINMGLKIAVPDEIIEQWNTERQNRGFVPYTQEEWLGFKEQLGEFMLIRGATGEELMEAILASIKSKLFGIVALDSISAILPAADAGKDFEDPNKVAARASLVTNFMTKFCPLIAGVYGPNYTTTIFTSQVRANQQKSQAPSYMQKYLKDWSVTGAHMARHTKSIDINVWNGEKIEKTISGEKRRVGKVSKYELVKGKHGTHEGISGEFQFFYEDQLPKGVDDIDTIMVEGMRHGVIVEKSGQVAIIKPETKEATGIEGIPNLPALKRMMEVDVEFEMAVRREVLAAKGIMCLYR